MARIAVDCFEDAKQRYPKAGNSPQTEDCDAQAGDKDFTWASKKI